MVKKSTTLTLKKKLKEDQYFKDSIKVAISKYFIWLYTTSLFQTEWETTSHLEKKNAKLKQSQL